MKVVSHKLTVPMAMLAVLVSGSVRADDVRISTAYRGGLDAKAQYCGYCHGSSGQGYRAYYTMPRLAGQQTEYFINQLRAFAEGRRDRHLVMNMRRVHGLSPALRAALAARFANLSPRHSSNGPTEQIALGRQIYQDGVPEANVPACAACHAPDAKGAGQNARLAGQLYSYTAKTLANWGKERGQDPSHDDASAVMAPVARSMSRQQIAAVAAYLSSLK